MEWPSEVSWNLPVEEVKEDKGDDCERTHVNFWYPMASCFYAKGSKKVNNS